MKLRNYQLKAVEAVLAAWLKFKSCVVILPTGCGKTIVFGEVIRRMLFVSPGEASSSSGEASAAPGEASSRKAMIIAHREELIRQAADKVQAITHADTQIEMGELHVSDMFGKGPDVVVSTVQTQITGRMHAFDPKDFGVLVVDEAHHATAKSYRETIDHYLANPACRLLGVTATPDRADELALGNVFDCVAFEYTMTEAIRDGWLVPVKQMLVKVGSLDFSKVSTTCGDFNQGELAEILEEEKNLHAIAAPTLEICRPGERAIVFAASVRQAERLKEILNRSRPNAAEFVCGKTEKETRRDILARFAAGKIQFVVNVGVLTEGFDDAGVAYVVMARPTKSRALYAQMAGRATRPAAEIAAKLGEVVGDSCSGRAEDDSAAAARRALIASSTKPCCHIIDFVGNAGRHKLVSTLDILGGKAIDEDEEEAKRRLKAHAEETGEEVDALADLEATKAKIKADRLAEEARRAFIVATAKYVAITVDPFDVYDIPPPEEKAKRTDTRQLSWKQKRILRERLRVNPDKVTPAEGKALIEEFFRRIKGGLATYAQAKLLRKHGIPVPMTFDEASRTLNRLLGGRGCQPQPSTSTF